MTKTSKKTTTKKSKKTAKPVEVKESPVEVKLGPFDFVKSIQNSKVNLIRTSTNPDITEKNYLPFITNRALSFYVDSIFFANEMNYYSNLDNKYQYEYLLHSVRPMKRNFSYLKHTEDENLAIIQEYYKVNPIRAREYLKILNENKINEIKRILNKGGVSK